MNVLLKLVFSDLKTNIIFFCLLIFNFTLGLTGFVALDSFKVGIQQSIKDNSKNYLSADLAVSARRLLAESEISSARTELRELSSGDFEESRLIEMFTMLNTSVGSRLVQLKIVDEKYPFYGQLKLEKNGSITFGKAKEINLSNKAWVYSDLLVQLNLKLGDTVKLGNLEFILSDVVQEDSTQTVRLASVAPKIYIGIHNLKQLGLIELGSTLTETRLYKVNPTLNIEEIKRKLFSKYQDPGIQVQSPVDAQEESGRVLGYLNDYLGLVSLVGFFLAMIGSTYLYRTFLNSRVKSVAIMNVLGLSFPRALGIYISELLLAALISAFLSIVLAGIMNPIIQNVVSSFTTVKVNSIFQFKSMSLAMIVALFGVIFSCLPYLVSIHRISTSQLLQEASRMILPFKTKDLIYFLPLLLFFFALSIFQSNSFKVGSMFFVGLITSFFLVFTLAQVFLLFFSKLKLVHFNFSFKQAVLVITRNRSQSIPVIIALAMAALLINLIPQLKAGLLDELSINKDTKLPGLFLFDIQDDQINELENLVNSLGARFTHLSPLIRARIISVNGTNFEKNISEGTTFKTREEEVEARFRNRGFNLSYRDQLSSSESIVLGKYFTNKWMENGNALAEISVEERFAARLGFKLGDILKFDVQGAEIEGKITSFRSVKWNSFQPNFFVVFQPGVLDEAPKSWLAAIPQIDKNKKREIQEKISQKFYNISSVDIEKVTHRILEMINQMSSAIQFMSLVSLLAGLFVIFSISTGQSQTRQWDLFLMQVLGARTAEVMRQSLFEAIFIGLFASFVGVFLSFIMAYIISYYIFDSLFIPDLYWPLVSVLIVTSFTALISVLGSRYNMVSQSLGH